MKWVEVTRWSHSDSKILVNSIINIDGMQGMHITVKGARDLGQVVEALEEHDADSCIVLEAADGLFLLPNTNENRKALENATAVPIPINR